jgi:hypothetical protein
MLWIFILILFIPLLVWYHWHVLPVTLYWCMYLSCVWWNATAYFSGPVLNSRGPDTGETGSTNFKFLSVSYSLHLFAIQYTTTTSFYCLSCCTIPEFCRQWGVVSVVPNRIVLMSSDVADVFNRRPVTAETRLLSQAIPCGICGGQSEKWTSLSLSTLVLFLHYYSTSVQ